MKNPFKNLTQGMKNLTEPQVKLDFSSCGEVLIDGLPFSFGVQSVGCAGKGLVVALSGDCINSGELRFDKVEVSLYIGGKVTTLSRKLQRVKKNDGKFIYQSRFPEIDIPECVKTGLFNVSKTKSREDFIASLTSEISFKAVPKYKGKDEQEVMITVYPMDNPLNGLAVNWKNCTSDKDYFLNKLK